MTYRVRIGTQECLILTSVLSIIQHFSNLGGEREAGIIQRIREVTAQAYVGSMGNFE